MATSKCPSGIGYSFTSDQKAQLGETVEVMLSTGQRFVATYAQITTQATTAATDIVAWINSTGFASGTVTADTTANQFAIAGLPMTGATAVATANYYGWVQTWGGYILGPNGTQVLGNQLLGDGSVAAGESMMASASTDGMVDTWATTVGYFIGTALEADAPAITKYILNCFGGRFC